MVAVISLAAPGGLYVLYKSKGKARENLERRVNYRLPRLEYPSKAAHKRRARRDEDGPCRDEAID